MATITDTNIFDNLEVGAYYGVTITGLTAGHTVALQYRDLSGWHSIIGTTTSGSTDQNHIILVTSNRIRVLVSAGTGNLQVGFTKVGKRSTSKFTIGLGDVENTSDADKPVSTAQQTALSSKLPKESINGFKVATTVGTTPATYDITDSDLGFSIQSDFAGETYYVLENTTVDGIVHIKAAATGNSRIYLDGSAAQYKDQFGNSVDYVDIPAGGMHSFIRANGLWSVLNASDPSKAPIDSTVNLTGDQTIAGEKTFTGQQELTGQTAATDDSAMTKGLIDDLEIYQTKTVVTGVVTVGGSADVVSVGFKDNGLQAPGNDAAARVCYLDIVSYYPAGGAGIVRYARYILSGRYIGSGNFESNTLEVSNVGDTESATISAPGKTVSGQSTVDVTITPPASGSGTVRSYIIKITPITTPVSW